MLEYASRNWIRLVQSASGYHPKSSVFVVEKILTAKADLASVRIQEFRYGNSPGRQVAINHTGIGIRQPDAVISLFFVCVNIAGRVACNGYASESPAARVEFLHTAVEHRHCKPAVFPAEILDKIGVEPLRSLLRIVREPVCLTVPESDSTTLRSYPQIAVRILLKTTDNGVWKAARHRFEVISISVRSGCECEFAAVGAYPYLPIRVAVDRPDGIVRERPGAHRIGLNLRYGSGCRSYYHKPLLSGHPYIPVSVRE